jgi:hypothetical protein
MDVIMKMVVLGFFLKRNKSHQFMHKIHELLAFVCSYGNWQHVVTVQMW